MTTSITSKALSAESSASMVKWLKANAKLEAAKAVDKQASTIMVDSLVADGITSVDYLAAAGKGKENTTLYKSVIATLATTLPAARQRALNGNPDTMTKAQMKFRRESMQRLGSKMSKVKNALEKELAKRNGTSGRAPGGQTNQTGSATPNTTPNTTPENNSSATPLKSYIENGS